ncbi:MAG: hypothetical protein H6936_08655 [Burkholderiales bacterium]|nr:hypothetical protein [Burkholderiales bacterium]
MCTVIQYHLGKGVRCAPPLHPPADGVVTGMTIRSILTTPSKRIAVLSLAGLGDMPLHLHRTMHNRLAD